MNNINADSPRHSTPAFPDRSALAVFFATILVCIISAVIRDRLHNPPFAEEAIVAGHLIHGDGFLSPYDASPVAPPSCYCAPVYPLVIAAAYRSVGPSHAILILLAVNSLSFGIIAASLFQLSRLYAPSHAGWLVALFLVLHPVLLYFVTDWWDSYVALAIFAALTAIAAVPFARRPLFKCTLMGVTMGVLSLTNPSYALAYPLLILMALRRQTWRRCLLGCLLCLAAFLAVLTPWTIRNALIFDRFIPMRGGTSYYLWLGNLPSSTGWLDEETVKSSPAYDPRERALILLMGEPAYFDLCGNRLKTEYSQAPEKFWITSAKRLAFIFMSDPAKAYLPFPMMKDVRWGPVYIDRALLHGTVLLLGLAGLWMAWHLRLGCCWIFAAALLAEVPSIFTFGSDRYNLPMRVILLFFAAILVACLIHRSRRHTWPPSRL